MSAKATAALRTTVNTLAFAWLASLALTAAPTTAHHSTTMFDREHPRVVEGTVKEFQWTNPHAWLQLEVAAEHGTSSEWSVELGGINSLAAAAIGPARSNPATPSPCFSRPTSMACPPGSTSARALRTAPCSDACRSPALAPPGRREYDPRLGRSLKGVQRG